MNPEGGPFAPDCFQGLSPFATPLSRYLPSEDIPGFTFC